MAVSGLPFSLDRGCGLDVHKDTELLPLKVVILLHRQRHFLLLRMTYIY